MQVQTTQRLALFWPVLLECTNWKQNPKVLVQLWFRRSVNNSSNSSLHKKPCYPSLLSLSHALWRLCRKFMLGLNDLFSTLWLQGLYRKALEVLKAPAINSEGKITIFYLCWGSFPSFEWHIDVIYMLQVPANRWTGEISSPLLEVISLDYLLF